MSSVLVICIRQFDCFVQILKYTWFFYFGVFVSLKKCYIFPLLNLSNFSRTHEKRMPKIKFKELARYIHVSNMVNWVDHGGNPQNTFFVKKNKLFKKNSKQNYTWRWSPRQKFHRKYHIILYSSNDSNVHHVELDRKYQHCWAFSSGAVTTCFYDFAAGIQTPNFPLAGWTL